MNHPKKKKKKTHLRTKGHNMKKNTLRERKEKRRSNMKKPRAQCQRTGVTEHKDKH